MQGGVELMVQMLGATPAVLAQFFTFLVLVLFMLIFGPTLYSTFIQVFPQIRDKQAATDLLERKRPKARIQSKATLPLTLTRKCSLP